MEKPQKQFDEGDANFQVSLQKYVIPTARYSGRALV